MSVGVVHKFADGTKEQYEASLAAAHPDAGRLLPDGQIFHAAGPSADGRTIVAVHDSAERWECSRDGVPDPRVLRARRGRVHRRARRDDFDVYNHQAG